jgi:DNA-binding response OmpR family regulator
MEQNSKKKILIVEDEKPMAHALELKLAHAGFDAKIVLNGEEAIDILKDEKFDLILCDLVMPELDGFSLMQTLKDQKNKIPIVVLSNLSQQDDENRARELGAINFFVKSDMPITEIIHYVEEILK